MHLEARIEEPVPPIFVFGTDAPSQKRCISLGTLGMVRAANEGDLVQLSIVVPVYNEEESLPHLLEQIRDAIQPTGMSYEVVCG